MIIDEHITIIATVYLNNDRSRPRSQTTKHFKRSQGSNLSDRFPSSGVTFIFKAENKLFQALMTVWYLSGISTQLVAYTSISGTKMLSPMLNSHPLVIKLRVHLKIRLSSFGLIILKEIRSLLKLTTHLWDQLITHMMVIYFWLDPMIKLCMFTKLKTKNYYLNSRAI